MTALAERRRNAVTGYVLAGGRSSRMGRDKALLELGGMTLCERAVSKLQDVVLQVRILSATEELRAFGKLVPDRRLNCGPLGGLEAALTDFETEWALLLPVDMPFIPAALLQWWAGEVVGNARIRIAMLRADGRLHPALLMVHREVAPFVSQALEDGERKLDLVLRSAASALAGEMSASLGEVLSVTQVNREMMESAGKDWLLDRRSDDDKVRIWFANVNTPAEFEAAERSLSLFDTQDRRRRVQE